MSFGTAFSSALSGLTAASKASELVSSNIANATTPGYGRRALSLAAQTTGPNGQGVKIVGINRAEDRPLLSDRRLAQSAQGDAQARHAFFDRLQTLLGTPDQPASLSGRVAALGSALTEAVSHPESDARLGTVAATAKALVSGLAAIGADIQSARTRADADILSQVQQVNAALGRAAKLNGQIQAGLSAGQDTSALQDQRQQTIDQIAQILPLREVAQKNGMVALYTTGGAVLLDGRPSVFGFTPTTAISPAMTLQSGGLSGLALNGQAALATGADSLLGGGTLAANFALRDDIAVSAQAQIDAVARDLVERFQNSALDPTRAVGAAGLFTDAGAPFVTANEVGLAQRLTLNRAVDPAQSGALWRLRDGLGATAPGPPGASALLASLNAALTGNRQTVSGAFLPAPRSFSVLTGDLLSITAANTLAAEAEATFATTRLETFSSIEAQGGVDTDFEMQSLLQIEQSYTANAKVLKAVGDMMQTLLDM